LPPKEAVKKIVEEVLAEREAAKEAGQKTEPVIEGKVDLSNAELAEKILKATGAGDSKSKGTGEGDDCGCGACGATFKGEKERCPECGKKLSW